MSDARRVADPHGVNVVGVWSCPVCVDTVGGSTFCLDVLCVTYWHIGNGSLVIPGAHLGVGAESERLPALGGVAAPPALGERNAMNRFMRSPSCPPSAPPVAGSRRVEPQV
jgi:hypothetical protein